MPAKPPIRGGVPKPPAAPVAPLPPLTDADEPTFVEVVGGMLTDPSDLLDKVKRLGGVKGPIKVLAMVGPLQVGLCVLLAVALAPQMVTTGVALAGLGAAVGVLLVGATAGYLVSAVGGGLLLHGLARVAGGQGTLPQSIRLACYLLAFLPFCFIIGLIPYFVTDMSLGRLALGGILACCIVVNMLVSAYSLYVMAIGLKTLHRTDDKPTAVVTGVLALMALAIILGGANAQWAAVRGMVAANKQKESQERTVEGAPVASANAKARAEADADAPAEVAAALDAGPVVKTPEVKFLEATVDLLCLERTKKRAPTAKEREDILTSHETNDAAYTAMSLRGDRDKYWADAIRGKIEFAMGGKCPEAGK